MALVVSRRKLFSPCTTSSRSLCLSERLFRQVPRHQALRVFSRDVLSVFNAINLFASQRADSEKFSWPERSSRVAPRLFLPCTTSSYSSRFAVRCTRYFQSHRSRRVSPRGFLALENVVALVRSRCPASVRFTISSGFSLRPANIPSSVPRNRARYFSPL